LYYWIQILDSKKFRKSSIFYNTYMMILMSTEVGTIINWPPGSGSTIEDYGSRDPDPIYKYQLNVSLASCAVLAQPDEWRIRFLL
jgi:hypothetical protein